MFVYSIICKMHANIILKKINEIFNNNLKNCIKYITIILQVAQSHSCFSVYQFHITACTESSVPISLGPVDFATGLVISILNLPNGKMKFLGGIQITEEL